MQIRSVVVVCLVWTLFSGSSSFCSDLALVHAKIYPAPTEPPIENGAILVRAGRILAVGPSPTITVPPDATVIDCKGLTVTAGFWNSHVHILAPGLLHARDASVKELDEQLNMMFNRWGFTTVFDISSVLDNTLALRRRIESKELRGPRILTVGEPVWTIEPVYVRDFLILVLPCHPERSRFLRSRRNLRSRRTPAPQPLSTPYQGILTRSLGSDLLEH
jgi:hypothetical protein